MAPCLVFYLLKALSNLSLKIQILLCFCMVMGAIHGEQFLGHISLNIWNFKKSFWHKLHLIRVY